MISVSDRGQMALDMQNDGRIRYGARMMMRDERKRFSWRAKRVGEAREPEKGEGEVSEGN